MVAGGTTELGPVKTGDVYDWEILSTSSESSTTTSSESSTTTVVIYYYREGSDSTVYMYIYEQAF